MKNIPNPSVALVTETGRPTSSMLDMIPQFTAIDVLADRKGRPTPLFLSRLQTIATAPLPNAQAQIVNRDGTPTRILTALLVALP